MLGQSSFLQQRRIGRRTNVAVMPREISMPVNSRKYTNLRLTSPRESLLMNNLWLRGFRQASGRDVEYGGVIHGRSISGQHQHRGLYVHVDRFRVAENNRPEPALYHFRVLGRFFGVTRPSGRPRSGIASLSGSRRDFFWWPATKFPVFPGGRFLALTD